MVLNTTVRTEPKESASSRTKAKLANHLPIASKNATPRPRQVLGGRNALLFHCAHKGCEWVGWLPTDELKWWAER